jgi:hypothetical protein
MLDEVTLPAEGLLLLGLAAKHQQVLLPSSWHDKRFSNLRQAILVASLRKENNSQ